MVIRKRQLLWDWTNTPGPNNPGVPQQMNNVPFGGNSPMASVINWNAWVPPELKGRAPFRPMVRVLGSTTGNDWNMIEATPFPIILFFNEPERAGITPEHARDIWYKQMLPLKHNKGKKLGSPAVAGDPEGEKWLQQFMKLVEKDPPDYLCLHYYSTSGDAAINYIRDMHKKYPHPPVMVTEIACIDRNYQHVLSFTIQVCNWMDQQDFIFEYGLFDFQRKVADNFVSPAAQLMDPRGNFTQLGNMYLHDQPMRLPSSTHPPGLMTELGIQQAVISTASVSDGGSSEAFEHVESSTPIPADEDFETVKPPTPPIADPRDESVHTNGNAEQSKMNILVSQTDNSSAVSLSPDQAGALKVQNDGRKGKGLTPLVWDEKLSDNALQWAKHLAQIDKMVHSSGDQRPGQGENLAMAWSSNGVQNPLTGGAKMWMAEVKNYHDEPIGQGNFESYGHYTQCMWRSTTKIGMASAKSARGAVYTVGRYSPPGNFLGQKPY